MVFFWQRKHRSAQVPVVAKTTPTHIFQSNQHLHSAAAPSLSILSTRAENGRQNPKISSDSTGSIGVGAGPRVDSDSNNNDNHSSKNHQLSPAYMLDRLSEYSRRKRESDRRKVAQRELDNLNMKIDKLLLKIEGTETQNQNRLRVEDECVVCLAAAATMQTFPCGHKVVCRKCLIKTIQVAVSQRCLPLRCVICRDRILTLHHTSLDSSSSPAVLQSSTLMPQVSQSVPRPASSPIAPASPTGLLSFITGTRFQNPCPRPLSPIGMAQGSQSLYSIPNVDKLNKVTYIPQSSTEDDFLRYTPTDIEAFVNSHNDALNLQRAVKPTEQRFSHKNNGHFFVGSSKRSDATPNFFMHSQPVKIHPAMTDNIGSFIESPTADSTVLATLGSTNLLQKSVGASKFLAKFLPRKNKRKYNWFRKEN